MMEKTSEVQKEPEVQTTKEDDQIDDNNAENADVKKKKKKKRKKNKGTGSISEHVSVYHKFGQCGPIYEMV